MAAVEIVDYRDTWPAAFRAIADELARAWVGDAVTIEHIGSTAVPGLCAKPVIDVLLGVEALAAAEWHASRLSALGYRYRPEYEAQIPDRRYFVRDATTQAPRVHLHAVLLGGRIWRDHLAFRDALRRDPALLDQYAVLKTTLAATPGKAEYTEAKGPFIRAVLASA
jgi:GrpB-like predicted nucleotidyltransferase (UPF0157 family)